MPDCIFDVKNTKFYLPDYKTDCIQKIMVDCNDYWDMWAHNKINQYLPANPVILDIGANIGSHTVYWALEKNAKKIYSFEPFLRMFNILRKNIEINNLKDRVEIHNYGLSDEWCRASVSRVCEDNLGNTWFNKDMSGTTFLRPLDLVEIKEKIDLIKIDVEGAEVEVLKGARATLMKNKPVLVIESFKRKEELESVIFPLGYVQVDTIRDGEDYIYKYKEDSSL